MLLWGQPLMKLFVLIVSPSVSFLFEITISNPLLPFASCLLPIFTRKLILHDYLRPRT
jgi:hypothetical protein